MEYPLTRMLMSDKSELGETFILVDSHAAHNAGFFYQLFSELWIYDATASGFQYHDRFVRIWLNMTA